MAQKVAFFFKQWGGITPKSKGRLLDGKEWNEFPMFNHKRSEELLIDVKSPRQSKIK